MAWPATTKNLTTRELLFSPKIGEKTIYNPKTGVKLFIPRLDLFNKRKAGAKCLTTREVICSRKTREEKFSGDFNW